MNTSDLRRSYQLATLNRSDLAESPVEQFRHWFDDIKTLELPEWFEPNAMTLSTFGKESVTSRIVLLKEFGSGGFVFFTSYESEKSRQIEANDRVALNFFWAPLERQIRIEGRATKTDRATSERYFKSRPIESQMGAIVSSQSSVIPNDHDLALHRDALAAKVAAGTAKLECPETWGGWIVLPDSFEFWQGRPSRLHDRFRYRKEGNADLWTIERLGP